MSKFYKFLWSIGILCVIVAAIILSVGMLLVGVVGAGVFGIYRSYLMRKRSRECEIKPYSAGEIIDLKPRKFDE